MTKERERLNAREANSADPMVGQVLGARYQLLSKLGQGGMGSVYLANDQRLEIQVAVKVIPTRSGDTNQVGLQRFRFEAHAAARIRSEHVVRVSDFGVSDAESSPVAYIAMEYLQGEDLSEYMARNLKTQGPLSWPRAKKLIIEIAHGLAAVHEAGLVHRDMKPSNCFLAQGSGGSKQIKIFDFGIAKSMDTYSGQLTREGMIVGTMAYMAPEQAAGKKVDGRSDIYALGAILFQMLSGRPPFIGGHWQELLAQIAHCPPPNLGEIVDISALPRHIDHLLLQVLQKDPERRFQNIAAFVTAIETLDQGNPLPPLAATLSERNPTLHTAAFSISPPSPEITVFPESSTSHDTAVSRESTASTKSSNSPIETRRPPNRREHGRRKPGPWIWLGTLGLIAIVSGIYWQQQDTPTAYSILANPLGGTGPSESSIAVASLFPNSPSTETPDSRSTDPMVDPQSEPLVDSIPSEPSTSETSENLEKSIEFRTKSTQGVTPSSTDENSAEDPVTPTESVNKGNKKKQAKADRSIEKQSGRDEKKFVPSTNLDGNLNDSSNHTKPVTPKPVTPKQAQAKTKPKETSLHLDAMLKKAVSDCRTLHLSAKGASAQVSIKIGVNGKIEDFAPLTSRNDVSNQALSCVGNILKMSLNLNSGLEKTFHTNRIINF